MSKQRRTCPPPLVLALASLPVFGTQGLARIARPLGPQQLCRSSVRVHMPICWKQEQKAWHRRGQVSSRIESSWKPQLTKECGLQQNQRGAPADFATLERGLASIASSATGTRLVEGACIGGRVRSLASLPNSPWPCCCTGFFYVYLTNLLTYLSISLLARFQWFPRVLSLLLLRAFNVQR